MGVVTGFSASVIGVLLIYWELIRPGTILAGAVGAMLFLAGCYEIWVRVPSHIGVPWCFAGALLIAAEIHRRARFVTGVIGLAALIAGSAMLFNRELPSALAVLGAVLVGAPGFCLAVIARRARENKRPSGVGNESVSRYVL